MLVQHASLGVGKVVALDPKAVHVFFAGGDARFATKLRLPMALSLLAPAAGEHAWLAGLSDFALDEKSGRYGLGAAWLPHAHAVERFRETYPEAFTDPKYAGESTDRRGRVHRWRRAHETWNEAFGSGEGERLLSAGDLGGLAERALRVERHVRPLHRDAEKAVLEDALRDPAAARGYFEALLDLVAVPAPDQVRFEALADAALALGPAATPESAWPLVTLLPFVARPDVHMVLRPRFAREVAERLGLELAYAPRPAWATYAALLRSTGVLLEKLRPLGARDHVDVESFMHVVTGKPARPKPQLRLVT